MNNERRQQITNGDSAAVAEVCMTGAMSKSSSPELTLRQLLRGSAPPHSPFPWDSDVPKSSPLSAQDLKSGVSQDMPVSSTAFQWSSGESHSNARSGDISSDTSGSLAEWTHFEPGLHHSSENDPHNILKELLTPLKDDPLAPDTVLKHLLNDKTTKSLENGSPSIMYQEQSLMNSFIPNHIDVNQNAPLLTGKRKIEEIDGAEPGNTPKLAEKNKMLAALLQNTTKQQATDGGLPVPNPGDLPQNKLPKDLSNRILAPPGVGQPRPPVRLAESIGEFGDDGMNRTHDNMEDVLGLLEDLVSEERPGGSDLGSVLTAADQQAIAHIRDALCADVSMNGPLSLQPVPQAYREQSIASSMAMGPRYAMVQNQQIVRTSMNVYGNNTDSGGMIMQRMPGNAMMLPNQINSPSRPGMPSDFNTSRSPVPPSGTSSNNHLKAQLRMQAWQRQVRAQQQGQASMGQAPGLPVSNNPASLQRSLSIPSPSGSNFPVNGFQNVPQNHPQFAPQQSVPYSPPPQAGLRFPVQTPAQPLSPRHPNPQVSGRMMRPGMWPQQSQLSGMGAVGAPQSPHPLQSNNSMNMAAVAQQQQQQNPPPYSTQQFINQSNGQQFNLSAHMMTQNPNQPTMQSRMTPSGGGGAGGGGGGMPSSQFSQQGTMQQDGFGNAGMYQRNVMPGMQSRMANPSQNQQLMRNNYSNITEDMRANDGSFGSYQMNGGINSAPPNLTSQQQFRWDVSGGDRSNMQIAGAPNLSSQNHASRMAAPTMSMDSYPSYDFFNDVDATSNGMGNNHTSQGHHVNEQQFRSMYSTEGQGVMSQHMNQSYAPAPDLMGVNRPGNSPVHQHLQQPPGDRGKSLLQELLSQNSV
ncbi:neurogenic protein mastermind-like isoform X3 [Paramacrobiotus metropolitanus]|uniref:neurogenic protein mastermind-like isoform X3 n=1 Tax=Paramacrobiotus metropolitanus TaxID=2943436 RepID=UPI0024458B23|nr:neurogenic protein mastermind-like isoform X3 [Paramacrobiotus metropolitanus]